MHKTLKQHLLAEFDCVEEPGLTYEVLAQSLTTDSFLATIDPGDFDHFFLSFEEEPSQEILIYHIKYFYKEHGYEVSTALVLASFEIKVFCLFVENDETDNSFSVGICFQPRGVVSINICPLSP